MIYDKFEVEFQRPPKQYEGLEMLLQDIHQQEEEVLEGISDTFSPKHELYRTFSREKVSGSESDKESYNFDFTKRNF